MKISKFCRFLVVVVGALGMSGIASAHEKYLGTITADATTAKNQSTTASAFTTIQKAMSLAVQCDADAYVLAFTSAGSAVTAASGVKVTSGALFDVELYGDALYVSVLSASGTANCKVFAVFGRR